MIWTLESRFIPALDLRSSAAGLFFALLAAILPARAIAADLLFEDVTASAGIDQVGESWGAAWGNFNNDPYPDLFTSNHRMHPSVFVNDAHGGFADVAAQVEANGKWDRIPEGDTHGAAWADFDNDGDQDLMLAAGGRGGTQFFVNDNGRLVFSTNDYGVAGTVSGGRFPVWFDYNNDGLLDFMMGNSLGYAQMFRQDSSTFTRTTSPGVYCSENPYGQLSDMTGNGRMELLCAHESRFPDRVYDFTTLPFTRLYDVMPQITPVIDTAIADFNGDLRPDIMLLRGAPRPSDAVQVGTHGAEAHLAVGGRNERGFTFDSTGTVTIDINWSSIFKGKEGPDQIRVGAAGWSPLATSFSLDPDDPDVWGMPAYSTSYDHGIYIGYFPDTDTWQIQLSAGGTWSTASVVVNSTSPTSSVQPRNQIPSEKPMSPVLFMSSGGALVDKTADAGLDIAIQCISVAAADIDNDMDIDMYLACRSGAANIANILLMNNGNGIFSQLVGAGGAEGVQGAAVSDQAGTSESVVAADYDVDGAIDLMVTNGLNMQPYHAGGPYQLFRNLKSNTNHWIEVDLQGSVSNRDGIGAIVYATAGGITQLREQNGGYHRWSQHHQRLHFGLAGNTTVDLRVEWPSGIVETYNDVQADRLYRIVENGDIETVELVPDTGDQTACGKPSYDQASDSGIFIWKDCDTGSWQVRLSAGGVRISTSGAVKSDQPFSSVTPVNLEMQWSDDLDYSSDPQAISYVLNVNNTGIDGFDFSVPESATVCLGVDAPTGTTARLGFSAVEVLLPFDLGTLGACSSSQPVISIDNTSIAEGGGMAQFPVRIAPASSEQVTVDYTTVDGSAIAGSDYVATSGGLTFSPGETVQLVSVPIMNDDLPEDNEIFTVNLDNAVNVILAVGSATGTVIDDDATTVCGAPVYNAAVDREVFLWKDCVAGLWRARYTAGDGGFLRYTGAVSSDQAFDIVTRFSIESGDTFDYTTDPAVISYQLGMSSPWEDGYDFSYPDGASACFDVESPSGISVLVGPERVPVQPPFDLETLQTCSSGN